MLIKKNNIQVQEVSLKCEKSVLTKQVQLGQNMLGAPDYNTTLITINEAKFSYDNKCLSLADINGWNPDDDVSEYPTQSI